MPYTISKDFTWSSSHQLHGLPDGHQCGRLHGHNYVARVNITADRLNEHGFVVDYGALGPFKTYIDDTLDHRHLNDILPCQPTAENLSKHLAAVAKDTIGHHLPDAAVVTVSVSETPKTWATWTP